MMDSMLDFLRKWWAVVIIPTLVLAYTLYNDWQKTREVFEITGLTPIALYDLRSDLGIEVPEFAALLVVEITNKSRKPIYVSRADCLVDLRATRILGPLEVLCMAFAGRPQRDYAGFVNEGISQPSISNLGSMASIAPVELAAGGIGYVTLLLNHNPEPPFPEGQQFRLRPFDTSRWGREGDRTEPFLIHEVVFLRSLDALYDSEQFDRLVSNEIQSYLGATVWLETTNGTKLKPVSIASLVLSEDASMTIFRSNFPFLNEFSK